jgi:hypothetical protein
MRVKKVVYCTPLLVGLLTRPGEPITASKGVSTGTVKVADFTDTAPDAATYTTSSYTVSINWEEEAEKVTSTDSQNLRSIVGGSDTYAAAGSYPVTISIVAADGRGIESQAEAQIAGLTGAGESINGIKGTSTGSVEVADFTDTAPDAATYTTSSYTVSINWEDGTTLTSGTINTDGSGGYAVFGTHTYTGQRGSHRMDQFVTNVTPSNKKRRTSGCRLGEWELFECNGALVDIRFFPKIGRKPAIRPLR